MKRKRTSRSVKRAFTLVELVVVIAILAVLSAVSVAGYLGYTDSANKRATDTLVKEVNTLYKAYMAGYQSTSNDELGVIDDAQAFIDYLDDNGIDRSLLNTTYIPVESSEESRSMKKAEGSSLSIGHVSFLVKGSGSYFGIMTVESTNYTLSNVVVTDKKLVKGLAKATEEVTGKSNNKTEVVWEFPIDSKTLKSDTTAKRVAIKANKDGLEYKTIYSRYGKKYTQDMVDALMVGGTSIYVSSTEFEGSYQSEDGFYYRNLTGGWLTSDNKEFDHLVGETIEQSTMISSDTLALEYKPLEDVEAPFVPVAFKTRANKTTYRTYDDTDVASQAIYNAADYPDEIIISPDDEINYYYEDGDSTFLSLGTFEAKTIYRINKLSFNSGCGGDSINKQGEANETISETTMPVPDSLTITNSLTLSEDATIAKGVSVKVLYQGMTSDQALYSFVEAPTPSSELLPYTVHGSTVLTITNNATLTLNGSLTLSALIKNTGGGKYNSGVLQSGETFSEIILEEGSKIIMDDSEAKLTVYGRITGLGTIEARKGNILDKFALYDWKGGSNLYGCYVSEIGGFPFYKYHLPDIACKTDIYSGVEYELFMNIDGGGGHNSTNITLIGRDGLFSVSEGYISKEVNEDFKSIIKICGEVNTNYIDISVSFFAFSVSFSGEGYSFPLYDMDIIVESGATFNIENQAFELMPGTNLTIQEGGTLNLSSSLLVFETFDYFKGESFYALDSFEGVAPAEFINRGTLNIIDGASIGGKLTNYGTLVHNSGMYSSSITPVIVIKVTGSDTASKPVYYENPDPIEFVVSDGEN